MRKNSVSPSGFFNPRISVTFTLCFVGALLATLSFAVGPDTWGLTGSMITPRQFHTTTPISACEILIAGGDIGVDKGLQATALRYQTGTGTWRDAGTMQIKREFHSATALASGGKVLVAGGIGSNGQPLASAEVLDPLANFTIGVWSLTGSLSTARSAHTATLLSNGQVLVAGGIDATGASLASAELYNPTTGTWTSTGSMLMARHDQAATMLSSGQVLVTGGIGANGAPLSSAELYNPTSGTWSPAGNMSAARAFHTATTVSTGIILISGGSGSSGVLASAELYNPTLGSFSTTSSMMTARKSHTATLLSSGQVLVAGGGGSSGILASAELYDPGAGVWLATASMAAARQFHTAASLAATGICSGGTSVGAPADFVMVAGGNGSSGSLYSAELYNQATGMWNPTGDMVTGRSEHVATLLPSGKVLVAGGVNGGGRGGELESALLYDPAAGTFSTTGSMSAARATTTATLLQNGKVLVAGGLGSNSMSLSSAELYDPATGIWSATGGMSFPRLQYTATLLPSGKVLAAGGGGPGFTAAELYDPASGMWSVTGSMSVGRATHTATLLNTGQVLVAGGSGSAAAELYNPATGSWSTTGSMSLGRSFHTAALLSTGKVLVAGGSGADGSAVTEAELYDRTTGTWSVTGFMNFPHAIFPAVLLQNSNVLVAGGDTRNGPISSAEFYVPSTGTWHVTGSMTDQRDWHTGTLLNTGKVLVTGGLDLASKTLATAELYDPGAPLGTPDSCSGVNVVTDPAGDAVNPAPGGAGPTDQADIVGISFSTDPSKTTLITTMTLHNLSQVPSPGTTFTTYNVVWTSSDGNEYATQVSAPDPSGSLSYFWGPWDSSKNQISPAHATTGTFNQGANGTVTVNVPLNGIGNPTIPITDPSQTAAVTNPFGLTFAGDGALGDGTTFTTPMDVAPNSGAGQRWAVCVPPHTVVSRKVHGAAGTFDINLPLTGPPGIECRSGGVNGDYTLVFTFAERLANVAGASVTSGTGSVGRSNIDTNDSHNYIVNLTGVSNAQHVTVTLSNVTDSAGNFSSAVSTSMSVLVGDTTGDGFVNSADISQTKSQSGNAVTSANLREDVNADGFINSADISLVKSKSGTALP